MSDILKRSKSAGFKLAMLQLVAQGQNFQEQGQGMSASPWDTSFLFNMKPYDL